MKKYKLTTQELTTHNGFQWELNKPVVTSGFPKQLCSSGYLHYYHHPLLAVLLNSMHSDITNPRLFEIDALGDHLDARGLKGGCTNMTLKKELVLPIVTITQRVAFGILYSMKVFKTDSYTKWALNWLSGKDRSASTAMAAANAATYADAATYAAIHATTYAAIHATYAANAATYADAATYAAIHATYADAATYATIHATYAANAATYAAIHATTYAAIHATYAAIHATYAANVLSLKQLIKLAKKAWTY
jgi:hypothetical protein